MQQWDFPEKIYDENLQETDEKKMGNSLFPARAMIGSFAVASNGIVPLAPLSHGITSAWIANRGSTISL